MKLTEREKILIQRRAKLISFWPIAGSMMIALVIGTGLWLVIFHPLLANPVHVMSRLETGDLHPSSLLLMAAILPFMTLLALGILLVLLVFGFATIAREKKYIEIINRGLDADEDES